MFDLDLAMKNGGKCLVRSGTRSSFIEYPGRIVATDRKSGTNSDYCVAVLRECPVHRDKEVFEFFDKDGRGPSSDSILLNAAHETDVYVMLHDHGGRLKTDIFDLKSLDQFIKDTHHRNFHISALKKMKVEIVPETYEGLEDLSSRARAILAGDEK